MPCEFLIDSDRRLVVSRGTGTFKYADFVQHMKLLGADRRFEPDFNHVVDCRKFDQFDVTGAQIQEMGSQSIFAPSSKRAFVVSSDLHFGLGRMFATHREARLGQTTMVFRELPEALKWIDLPPDYDPHAAGEPTLVSKGR